MTPAEKEDQLNAGTTAQRTVAESQAPAPSEPGDRGVAPTLDAARPALSGPEMVPVPRDVVVAAERKLRLIASIYAGDKESRGLADELLDAERKEEGK